MPDPEQFDGFGPGLVAFYDELAGNNERDWFKAHRATYDEQVLQPLQRLAAVIDAEYGETKIFRPFRDVRFSKDKRPIQEHASLVATVTGGYAYYLQVSADGLLLAGGLYQPERPRLEKFRERLDDDATVTSLHAVLDEVDAAGFTLSADGRLKTAPRGYRADHPEIELLRCTQLAISRNDDPGPWLAKPECLDRVRAGFAVVRRWNDWLGQRHI